MDREKQIRIYWGPANRCRRYVVWLIESNCSYSHYEGQTAGFCPRHQFPCRTDTTMQVCQNLSSLTFESLVSNKLSVEEEKKHIP